MNRPGMPVASFESHCEDRTARCAEALAALLKPGDLVTLAGDLGAGKTHFVRAVMRWLAADETLEVPSPTYGLVHHYDDLPVPVAHADFYRLNAPEEAVDLALDEMLDHGIVLVEWPDRGELPQTPTFEVTITVGEGNSRQIAIACVGADAGRLTRLSGLSHFLYAEGYADAPRTRLQGDASTRRYERLASHPPAILMDAPRQPDGLPVKDGKPYSRLVHLAEDVTPFVAVAEWLGRHGLSAPEIFANDTENGFIILEDLGKDGVVSHDGAIIEERYRSALDTLASLHRLPSPGVLSVGKKEHAISIYDPGILAFETELFGDWFLPEITDGDSAAFAAGLNRAWITALNELPAQPRVLVLRDFHSPNLIWLDDRMGENRIGLIDFQDALIGHPAYDVASLCQDARLTVSRPLETALLAYYRSLGVTEDWPLFEAAYALLSAQRATKILGIFLRLYRRDAKPEYLRHLPRLADYLDRSLSHPVLEPVRVWHEAHFAMPALAEACERLSRLKDESE